ncbi:hypothetical protein [Acuticoccus sp. I52.16.1]|uniref:hypothetical protein n=1 Tax=Acuticoccus sp. I52.16.1 TaxID=2928472 RepID=UPI001FD2166E|nr:hypothetical protein [Acuticoccus sp. I52.16.1]UOM33490.1 hypothetical protein MRB58_16770 [Acuticoccus sp. I52.16.1]
MRWRAALAALLLLVAPALAQNDAGQDTGAADAAAPRIEAELSADEAIPGQAVSLRVTVLVPTFMPKPPVWPSLEAPNLWVRVASTGPTSKSIGGETWSGVSRRYLLSPMVPGPIRLPPGEVGVTYADPDDNTPRTVPLALDAITLTGTVPEGAEGLDPFIAAQALTLTQDVSGSADAMKPGDSVARTVKAKISGTSPMFLPRLLPATEIAGVRAYPDEPVLEEATDRGTISGTRTERVTLVAEGGGAGAAPAISLDWYNLARKAVETATVDGFAVQVDGPPATRREPRDWRLIGLVAAAGVLGLSLLLLVLRRAGPPLVRAIAARRAARRASEAYAFHALVRTVRAQDDAGLRPALDTWAARSPTDPRRDADLVAALTALGEMHYRDHPGGATADGAVWQRLAAALRAVRHRTLAHRRPAALPPLNPGAPART